MLKKGLTGSGRAEKLRVLLSLFALAVLLTALGCFARPAVRLERIGSSVVVHVDTLGEYPTTVRHIRLWEASSGKVLFELLAKGGTPQIYFIRLSAGENSTQVADPEHGSYRVVEPGGRNSFSLQQGVQYRLTIWGSGLLPSESDIRF